MVTSLDGVFGPETQRAVVAFQMENWVTPDGIVGRNTWSKVSHRQVAELKYHIFCSKTF